MAQVKREIFLDTETTGLNPVSDEILQLSILNIKSSVLFNEYFRPLHVHKWEAATAINHITPDMVKTKKDISEYREELQKLFDRTERIIGWNIDFDVEFLRAAGFRIDEEKIIDCMSLFARMYECTKDRKYQVRINENGKYCCKLKAAAELLGIKYNEHNSLSDTDTTVKVFNFCEKIAREIDREKHYSEKTLNERNMIEFYFNLHSKHRLSELKYYKPLSVSTIQNCYSIGSAYCQGLHDVDVVLAGRDIKAPKANIEQVKILSGNGIKDVGFYPEYCVYYKTNKNLCWSPCYYESINDAKKKFFEVVQTIEKANIADREKYEKSEQTFEYRNMKLKLKVDTYVTGNLCVSVSDENNLPCCKLTTNIPHAMFKPDKYQGYVNFNDHVTPGLAKLLTDKQIIKPVGPIAESGYNTYALVEFDKNALALSDPVGFSAFEHEQKQAGIHFKRSSKDLVYER